jgi:hypothetical protein
MTEDPAFCRSAARMSLVYETEPLDVGSDHCRNTDQGQPECLDDLEPTRISSPIDRCLSRQLVRISCQPPVRHSGQPGDNGKRGQDGWLPATGAWWEPFRAANFRTELREAGSDGSGPGDADQSIEMPDVYHAFRPGHSTDDPDSEAPGFH